MRRREFVKRAVLAAGAGLAVSTISVHPSSRSDESLLWPYVAEPLANRRNNKIPNYTEIHRCFMCEQEFYCPDRWLTQRCEPKALCEQKGWSTDSESCLPCKFGPEAESDEVVRVNMIAWREAHFVNA